MRWVRLLCTTCGAVVRLVCPSALASTPTHVCALPSVCRSLYIICLVICVNEGLFGFKANDNPRTGAALRPQQSLIGSGDGRLEEGLLTALQNIGGIRMGVVVSVTAFS